MNTESLSQPETETEAGPHEADLLASGVETPLRKRAAKLGAWLFSPPPLPGWLILVAMLAVVFMGLVILMQQVPEYWINTSQAVGGSDITPLLSRAPLIFIAPYVLFAFVIGLLLSVLNRAIGAVVWLGLFIYYMQHIAGWGWCGVRPLFRLTDTGQCLAFQHGWFLFVAIIFGIVLSVGVRMLSLRGETATSWHSPYRAFIGVSATFFILIGSAIVYASSAPKPEWHLFQPAHAPPARTSAALSYDAKRGAAVLFGGSNSTTSSGAWNGLNDTWEWDGSDWTQRQPSLSPPARLNSAMVYDPKRGVTVLFGGQNQNSIYSDTWEWDGQNWHQVFPKTSPPARAAFGMYYDPRRQGVVIYGGLTLQNDQASGSTRNIFFDDVWVWDGQNWSQIPVGPTRLADAIAIAYDPGRGEPMYMDGVGLWAWKGNGWQPDNSDNAPPNRFGGSLVYDPLQNRLVLFGGDLDKRMFNDTWVFEGSAWKSVLTAALPAPRYAHVMVFDLHRKSILLFGGYDGIALYNDTWELRLP